MDFIVGKEDESTTVNSFLRENHKFSRRHVSSLKFENGILVNGEPVWTNHVLHENDVVTIIFSDKKSEWVYPENTEIDIIFEDEHILAVNKPPNMPPHPSIGHSTGTLANAVAGYYKDKKIDTAVRILGRLDKDTSGVVILCKDRLTHKLLAETEIEKYYVAICEGVPPSSEGRIDAPIARIGDEMRRIVDTRGKTAVTLYKTIETKKTCSLVKLKLVTGRTHQIRVHLSHIGCPIAGDELYGSNLPAPRQLLHAQTIEFDHPFTKEKMSITAKIPNDFDEFWQNFN